LASYAFHDLTLKVHPVAPEIRSDLDQLLHDLSWTRIPEERQISSLSLAVRLDSPGAVPRAAPGEMPLGDGFRGSEDSDAFDLTDGESLLRVESRTGHAEVRLAPSFLHRPPLLRQNFWVFGLMKLLQSRGFYGLHAAALVRKDKRGLLVVGESGSGKSTLAIALIRQGWGFLSDDAVVLRARPEGIEALALRRHMYVKDAKADAYQDLGLGEARADWGGGSRRQVRIEAAHSAQRTVACSPSVLLFPRIVRRQHSAVTPIGRVQALQRLLEQSGPQLFDRRDTGPRLSVLKSLLDQCAAYDFRAGADVLRDPAAAAELLETLKGDRDCLASSSS
jgi:hypothetical protein